MLVLTLTILGCGDASDSAPKENRDESLSGPALESINKAKAVENQLMDQKDSVDQAIDDAESGGGGTKDEVED